MQKAVPDVCDDCAAKKLQFEVSIIDHIPKKIEVQLDFYYPSEVSSTVYGRDILITKLLMPELFLSSSTLK
jgi:hypothetical protein